MKASIITLFVAGLIWLVYKKEVPAPKSGNEPASVSLDKSKFLWRMPIKPLGYSKDFDYLGKKKFGC